MPVRAVPAEGICLNRHDRDAALMKPGQKFLCKNNTRKSRHQMQARSLSPELEAIAEVPRQALQQALPFALIQLSHFPDMPFQTAPADESGQRMLRQGVCVHVRV